MSRRKQSKPQQRNSEHDDSPAPPDASGSFQDEPPCLSTPCICILCCAEFPSSQSLLRHQVGCSQTQQRVLMMPEDSASPGAQVHSRPNSPGNGTSLEVEDTSCNRTEPSFERMDMTVYEKEEEEEGPKDMETDAETVKQQAGNEVTLEVLEGTKVAMAQVTRTAEDSRNVDRAVTGFPLILEQLSALQHQQLQQLQLLEQLRNQLTLLAPAAIFGPLQTEPLLLAHTPGTKTGQLAESVPENRANNHSTTLISHLGPLKDELSMSTADSSKNTYQAPDGPDHLAVRIPNVIDRENSAVADNNGNVLPQSTSPPCGFSSTKEQGQSTGLIGVTPNFLFGSRIPQSLQPSDTTFPNPLTSMAAVAMVQSPLGKPGTKMKAAISRPESKCGADDGFFKHKCRFCSKVFGSDSALQIHLRSHTGERPFKCNICGNRFSTKGNLKVHFHRHKDRYPYIQMNPFPVPEHLDHIPTSSGIPYGMSMMPETSASDTTPTTLSTGSSWLDDCKPPAFSPIPSLLTFRDMAGNNQSNKGCSSFGFVSKSETTTPAASPSVIASNSTEETNQDSPNALQMTPTLSFPTITQQPATVRESENVGGLSFVDEEVASSRAPSTASVDSICRLSFSCTEESDVTRSRFPFIGADGFLEKDSESGGKNGNSIGSSGPSETSKLQRLVETINQKMGGEGSQCTVCQRVLSCPNALRMHHRMHTGERPYLCKVCGRAFTTKGNLKTHYDVHRAKPETFGPLASCPICQKGFSNALLLQHHVRMHVMGKISAPGSMETEGILCNEYESEPVSIISESGRLSFAIHTSKPPQSPPKEPSPQMMQSPLKCDTTLAECSVKQQEGDGLCEISRLSESPCSSGSAASLLPSSPLDHWSDRRQLPSPNQYDNMPGRPESNRQCSPGPTSESGLSFIPGTFCKTVFSNEDNGENMVGRAAGFKLNPTQAFAMPDNATARITNEMQENQNDAPRHIQNLPTNVITAIASTTASIAPARRTAKQHLCLTCGKPFSSSSALQIHERTHTGEKPFGCSICGRAFTTKGNLKVHMGTHMWNNAPQRRGRRLTIDTPAAIAFLSPEASKFPDLFGKELPVRAPLAPTISSTTAIPTHDTSFWSQYAAVLAQSGLALKPKEISVIQNGAFGAVPMSLSSNSGGPTYVGLAAGLSVIDNKASLAPAALLGRLAAESVAVTGTRAGEPERGATLAESSSTVSPTNGAQEQVEESVGTVVMGGGGRSEDDKTMVDKALINPEVGLSQRFVRFMEDNRELGVN
uniref:Homeotic protein spalt-major n=1 Tax=Eptatretus burgeri TaxID=7764 RepID=A0A8C4QH55_EPTBU